MNKSVYMHTTSNRQFNSRKDINAISSVLDSGFLLSLRNQGISESHSFAGLDHISLCDYERKEIRFRFLGWIQRIY